MKNMIAMAALLAGVMVSGIASAAPKDAKIVDNYFFDVDSLSTTGGSQFDHLVGRNVATKRTILAAPRAHFIPELLKSVEDL